MITIICDDGIMPQNYHFTAILVHFFKQSLALKICLILAEIHIVTVAQCAVHHGQRMQHQVGELHGLRINPSYWSGSLQTEAHLVGEHHCEVIGHPHFCQSLHLVYRATQIVTAM